MSRIQIPIEALTSRLNIQDRLQGFRSGPLSGRLSNLRPVSEFLDFKRLSKPANFAEAQSRVNYNLAHFSSNYVVVFAMLSLYALFTNWVLLFDLILIIFGLWFIGRLEGRDLEIGTFRATSSQLYTGLLIVTVPLGLFASPFSTLLWLIGATGVTVLGHASGGGLGGRPRAPKFAPQWGRPSRRGRRKTDGDAAHIFDFWGGGGSRVQELDSDGEDTDTQGVGLTAAQRRNSRFVSDSLQFTGIDLGDRTSGTARRRFNGGASEDDEDDEGYSTTGSGSDEGGGGRRASYDDDEDDDDSTVYDGGGGTSVVAVRQREDVLVQSALRRIARAQAKGKADVKLTKDELAALQKRRQRMQEEEERERKKQRERERERRQRGSGSGSDRKKSKEQRVAVPLTQLQPTSRKKQSSSRHPPRKDSMARHASASNVPDSRAQLVYPPMGYFPPPSASRARARSSAGQAFDDNVQYGYPPPPLLPVGAGRSRSSRGSPRDDATMLSSSRSNVDPFQYQTTGQPRQSKRHVSGPAEFLYGQTASRGATAAAATRSRHASRRTSYNGELSTDSQTSEESISDERGNGAQIREPTASVAPTSGHAGGRNGIIVEVSPERKKKKSSSSPVKRKSSKKKKK